VGLMSVGSAGEAERFALTLQTGKRWSPAAVREGVRLRERFARLRWLTEDVAREGVRVQVEAIPPDPSLVKWFSPSQSAGQASETLQIWWLRERGENLSRALERAVGSLNPQRDRLMLVGLPPKGESLAPVILAGSGLSTGVLTSATTRTEGVVSDVDLTPTLLQWMGLPLRVGEHPMRVVRKDPFSTTQSLAQRYRWNAQALIPLGAVQVLGGLLAVLASLRQARGGSVSRRGRLLLSVAIGLLLSLPAGTVIAPYLPASNLTLYVANILLAAAGLSLLAHWGVWEQPFRAYIRACALSALVLLADTMSGQQGAKFSVYSAYALSGIRFYGIGNELMGVLVGCALAWGIAWLTCSGERRAVGGNRDGAGDSSLGGKPGGLANRHDGTGLCVGEWAPERQTAMGAGRRLASRRRAGCCRGDVAGQSQRAAFPPGRYLAALAGGGLGRRDGDSALQNGADDARAE
ncbi:MAG: hypothetical protein RMM06_03765, partial [Armatimonadota bacterium]|nr:hypothetical protein [Armatimonadota bacterium]